RLMAYIATIILVFALWGGWVLYRKKLEHAKWFLRLAPWAVIAPFLMNTAGWMLTENGRQPWIVQGLMKTVNASSPSVSTTDIWISLAAFVIVYSLLGAADLYLMLRYARKGLPGEDGPGAGATAGAGAGAGGPTGAPGQAEPGGAPIPALTY
ncbi:MAG TPA: cytochrome ubiquinol oxidase subunit I, partial [Solirubrobacteraceae bacterium]|nr:cytochrome ubiquinol oxidase subunit I [Solirubrobacteraceae bacterium]